MEIVWRGRHCWRPSQARWTKHCDAHLSDAEQEAFWNEGTDARGEEEAREAEDLA